MRKIVTLLAVFLLSACNEAETENYSKAFTDHPLSGYFHPHGQKALMYFGNFRNICDKKNVRYVKEECDAAVERGIRIGKSVGIELERNDLVNEVFWEKTLEVGQESLAYYEKHVASQSLAKEDGSWVSPREKASKEFDRQSNEFMKNMDDNYAR